MLEWCIYTLILSTIQDDMFCTGWLAGQRFSANVTFITFDTNLSHVWCLRNKRNICTKNLARQSAIVKCKDRLVYKYLMHHSNIFWVNLRQITEPEMIFVTYLPHFGALTLVPRTGGCNNPPNSFRLDAQKRAAKG